jgi:hypothetical protein
VLRGGHIVVFQLQLDHLLLANDSDRQVNMDRDVVVLGKDGVRNRFQTIGAMKIYGTLDLQHASAPWSHPGGHESCRLIVINHHHPSYQITKKEEAGLNHRSNRRLLIHT